MTPDLEIHPLTRERLPHLARLFGQGGDPKWCWCASFRVRGMTFRNASARENRAVLEAAVDQLEGRAPGLIAYRDGEAIGWVSLGPREDYERLKHSKILAPIDDRPVWSIVCFVVGRRARGQGVAKKLLDAAVDYAREHGATLLEAYPVETDGGRIPSANAYMGTRRMFEVAGFDVVERRQWNRATSVRPIVRRRIRAR
ncbi:GNAT family N-acetyltransferase [soil metagenome]